MSSVDVPPPSRRLDELRGPDIGRLLSDRSILVQPLGAIEQHGPHLPFNTDLVIADRVSEAAVRSLAIEHGVTTGGTNAGTTGDRTDDATGDRGHDGAGPDVWLLPPLAYTKSNEHAWSAGTIWLSATTLLSVLDDIGRCVAATPARKLVFFNGHGGNSALVNVANRELRLAHGLMTFLAHPGMPPDQGGASPASELGMGIHGGLDETSLMLHLTPELVDLAAGSRNVPEALADNRHVRFGGSVSFGWLSNDFGPDGHIGDPTGATADRGAALFDGAVAAFVDALTEIDAFDLPDR